MTHPGCPMRGSSAMPNRILWEKICRSETIAKLSAEEERFFYRLIVQCDDYGRFDGRATVLRSHCFSVQVDNVSDHEVERWLQRLVEVGLVVLYTVDERPYLVVTTWSAYQRRRASRSRWPDPPVGTRVEPPSDDVTCRQMSPANGESIFEESRNEIRNSGADAAAAPRRSAAGAAPPRSNRNLAANSSGERDGLDALCAMFEAHGLGHPLLTRFEAEDARKLLQHYEPEVIVACWQDIASGDYGGEYDRRNLSFSHLAKNQRIANWQRERDGGHGGDVPSDVLLVEGIRT